MTEARTLAPPERRVAEVLECRRVGAYTVITAADAARAGRPTSRPVLHARRGRGVGWRKRRAPLPPARLLLRPCPPRPGGGTELEFLLEDVGPGTHRLGLLRPGEPLALVGRWAWGSAPRPTAREPLLVGGGIGTAPLLCLHDELTAPARRRRAARLSLRGPRRGRVAVRRRGHGDHRRRLGRPPRPGHRAPERASRGRPAATVYACGPPPMLEAVRALCAERSVPAQLALESGMACGFGACFGCVVPTREGYIRVCVDGPVVEGALWRVRWLPVGGIRDERTATGRRQSTGLGLDRSSSVGSRFVGLFSMARAPLMRSLLAGLLATLCWSGFPLTCSCRRRSPSSRGRATRRRGCGRRPPGC